MKNIRIVSFLLAMFLLLPTLVSCGDDSSDKSTDCSSVSGDTSNDGSSESTDDVSGDDASTDADIIADLDGHLKNSVASSDKDGVAKDKNIIMIQLNSVSDPIMGASNGSVTPYINSIKGEGIYFSNFFNQATDREDIEYSVLNSLLSPLGFSLNDNKVAKFNTLAAVLEKSGYSTSVFTGVDEKYTSGNALLKRYGFDKISIAGSSDQQIYDAAYEEIKSNSSKGFYFISNIDSCYPYISSEKNDSSVNGAGMLTSYANAVSKADASLKTFIEKLSADGILDNSVVVIYGSSPMFDYTYEEIEKKCSKFLASGIDVVSAHKSPMVILGLEKTEYKELATVYDIYPTLVALAGADDDGILVCGENLFSDEDRSNKIFPIQDTLFRGSYISDKVCYVRYSKSSVKCYDRVTGETYKTIDYKSDDTLCKHIANESEFVIKSDYFNNSEKNGETESLKAMYKDLPSTGKLTMVNDALGSPTAKTALMSYHTQFFYAYDYKAGLYGTKINGRKLIIDTDKKEGTFIPPIINAGKFEVLYTGWDIVYNGGSAEIYVSVTDANGIETNWLQIAQISDYVVNCTSYEDENVKVDSSRVYIKNGKSNGNVRIKIKLISSPEGKSPELEYFTFTTDSVKTFDSNKTGKVAIEKAELKVSHAQAVGAKQSGAVGVACLVSSMTGKKPDIIGASAKIYDQASDSYSNLAAICEYVHSLGIDAFIDYLDAEGVARVLEKNQQVLCFDEKTNTFSIIYGFEGKKKAETYYVYDIVTGKDKKVSAKDYAENWNGMAVIMNTYAENITPLTECNGKSSIMPISNDRTGKTAEKNCIIVHNTGNYNAGANAANHVAYKLNNTATNTSWHFTVDDKLIYQHLPTDEKARHAGDGVDGRGNQNGIGIEICVNGFPEVYSGEEYEAWEKQFFLAIENSAQLVAQLLVEYNLKPDCVFQHYDMAPEKKNCPMQMRYSYATKDFVHEGDLWIEFMTMVELRYNRLLATGDKFDTVNVD